MKNGQWYVHAEFNKTWTNLSGCYDVTKPYGTSILVPAIIQVIICKLWLAQKLESPVW
jgi:hypothetical protein